ncbi:MAG: MSMEG_4193 family putative phosphomutase [Actinomycetota bacterium]
MALLLLVRHGLTAATGKRLYGRSPGVHLSEAGRGQAQRVAERLAGLRLAGLYSSPLERCVETADPIARACRIDVRSLPEVVEVDYGTWTGRPFSGLRRTKLWREVHARPSSVRFPGGESLLEVQRRTVDALVDVARRHGKGAAAVVSHGDVIRVALAHFVGLHIDLFHRMEVGPGSVSAVLLGDGIPRVLRLGDTGALDDLVPGAAPRVRG